MALVLAACAWILAFGFVDWFVGIDLKSSQQDGPQLATWPILEMGWAGALRMMDIWVII